MRIKNIHTAIICIVLSLFYTELSAQSTDPIENPEPETEKVTSIVEERKATIKYGINEEIITVLSNLKEERDTKLTEEVLALFENTYDQNLIKAIMAYFQEIDFRGGEEYAFQLLQDYHNQTDDVIAQLINYLIDSKKKDQKWFPVFKELITSHDNSIVVSNAIKGLSASGDRQYVDFFLELLEDDTFSSEFKPNLILGLGELGSKSATPVLIDIVTDETESIIWRQYACDSLGKIKDPEALEPLQRTLSSENAMLRAYAVHAISNFNDQEIAPMLHAALKDSYYKVRIRAAEGLAKNKIDQSIDILIYKANKDPEIAVREAAIKALAQIGGDEAYNTVAKLFTSSSTPYVLRITAFTSLLEANLEDSLENIETVILQEWNKEHSKLLEHIAKQLSHETSPGLEPVYKKLLDHSWYIIKIHAFRGISNNNFIDLKEDIERYTREGVNPILRKNALSVLEDLL